MPSVAYWVLLLTNAECEVPASIETFEFDHVWHTQALKSVPSKIPFLEHDKGVSSYAPIGHGGEAIGIEGVLELIESHELVHDVRVQDLFVVCPGLTEADQGLANEFGYDVVQTGDFVVLHLRETNERMARE